MAKHAWIQEHLAAYLAGGLDAEHAARLEEHVAGCPNCARDLAETRQADQVLSALFSSALPDAGLEDRLVQGLRKTRARRFPRLQRYRQIAAAVAAVFLLALVGWQINGLNRQEGLALPDLGLVESGHIDFAKFAPFFYPVYQSSAKVLLTEKSDQGGERAWSESKPAESKSDNESFFRQSSIGAGTGESLGERAAEITKNWKFRALEGKDANGGTLVAGSEVTKDNVIRRQIGMYPSQTLTYPNLPYAEKRNVYDTDGSKLAESAQAKQNQSPTGGQGAGETDERDPFPPELQDKLGYYPPARALVVKGTSRMHSNLGSEPASTAKVASPTSASGTAPMGGSGGKGSGGAVEPGLVYSVLPPGGTGSEPGIGRGPNQASGGIGGGIGGINGGIGGIGGGIGGIGGGDGSVHRSSQTGALMSSNDQTVGKSIQGPQDKASPVLFQRGIVPWKDAPSNEKLEYFKPNEVKFGESGKSQLADESERSRSPIRISALGNSLLANPAAEGRQSVNSLAVGRSDLADKKPQQAQSHGDDKEKELRDLNEAQARIWNVPAAQAPKEPVTPRKVIIRTGEMEFEVESFDAATTVISLLVNAIPGGFIATTNSEKLPNGKVRGAVVVRVPPEHLDELVAGLRKNLAKGGELKSQRIGSQDITKQYTDLESRLRAARTMQERLLQIIKSGKGEVKDLLNVEKELAVWGTKIEEMEGELRYFAHQVALSTLTITLTEKEIKAPYGVLDTERVNMGIEVEDVEKAQTQTLAIVADVKGRITKSELKRLDAGQFNAVINFEVPPDATGPVRDRLKQLGNVARFDANRVMETEGGTGKPLDGKVTRKDAQFFLSLYNLANVAPREVTNFDVVTTDAEAAYKVVLTRVQKLGGRIVTSNLNRQNNDQTVGTISFQVKANEADALLQELKAIGETLRHQTTENPDSSNTTQSKRGFLVQILAMGAVPSRETAVMQLATPDVPTSYRKLREAISAAKGRMLSAQLNEQSRQNATASLDFEVRREQEGLVQAALSSAGDVLSRNVTRVPENETALNSKVHLQVTLIDAARIPPREATSLGIETADVDAATTMFTSIVRDAGGRTAESHAARERNGKVTAKLIFYVPLAVAAEVVDRFKSAGVVRVQEKERNPQVSDGTLAVARIDVTLSNSDLILTPDQGMWPQIRKGLTTSFVGLSWSLTVVIIGLLFVLPWALAIYVGYRMVRWMRGAPRSA